MIESEECLIIKKQSGMTLVEVLATLVLSSIVIALIWTAVTISMKYNIAETKKTHLQQEANYVITQIQNFHRKCDTYNLNIDNKGILIKDCKGKNSLSDIVINNGYNYGTEISKEVSKKIEATYELKLTVQDIQKEKLIVVITTNISRYKE